MSTFSISESHDGCVGDEVEDEVDGCGGDEDGDDGSGYGAGTLRTVKKLKGKFVASDTR